MFGFSKLWKRVQKTRSLGFYMSSLIVGAVTALALSLVVKYEGRKQTASIILTTTPRDDTRCFLKTSQYEVVACWPHRCDAFTEGLEIHSGFLYESTGGDKTTYPRASTLRRVGLRTGAVLESVT